MRRAAAPQQPLCHPLPNPGPLAPWRRPAGAHHSPPAQSNPWPFFAPFRADPILLLRRRLVTALAPDGHLLPVHAMPMLRVAPWPRNASIALHARWIQLARGHMHAQPCTTPRQAIAQPSKPHLNCSKLPLCVLATPGGSAACHPPKVTRAAPVLQQSWLLLSTPCGEASSRCSQLKCQAEAEPNNEPLS